MSGLSQTLLYRCRILSKLWAGVPTKRVAGESRGRREGLKRKYGVLVLTALLAILAALLFVVLQDYMNGTGSFHSSAISWSSDLLTL